MKKDKNNQNINSIPKYQWGNYFKKPIKWLAHQINNYGNSKHPFITTGTSYAYAIGDEKRRHPELTEQQIHEIVNSRIKQNRKKLGLPTDNNTTPSQAAAGLALGSLYYPWLAVPDIIFDTAASIDEPSTSNNIHTIADFPETVAKFTPSKIDDYVAKGVQTLGNIDDAVSTSGRNMFSNFDKKSGKINNTTDKTSVRESTNIRYRKNGGQIRKMQTASGGPIYWLRKRLYNNIEPFGYNDVGSRLIDAIVLNKNEHDNFKGNYSDPEKAPAQYQTIDNIWGEYLHIPEKERRYSNGKYKIKNNGNGTFSLPFESMEDIMQTINSNNPLLWGQRGKLGNSVVGEYDVHRGYDKNGDYLKYIDHWRINPYDVKEGKEYGQDDNSLLKWYFKGKDDASFGLGTPVEIQGKYYLDDIYNVKGKDRGGHYLPEVVITGKKKQGGKMNILEFLKNGSGIHIKEKNKGKFTSYCGGKVTDECIQKGKNSSNPAIRKRATFAANARKWKHKEGGIIRKMKTAAGGPIEKVPEVVITPDKNTKILGNNIRGIIKDPVLRNNFYKYILNSDEYRDVPYISDNEKIQRFINLYKKSGNPKVHVISPHGRPYYIGGIPFMNDIYASTSYYDNEEDNANIVAELSHAYQYNNNYAKQLKLKPGIIKELKQGVNRIFNEDEAYDKVGNVEYDAHSIIEPAMHEYISGSTDNFEKYLKNFTNEVRNYPKYYSSGVDKFASYYKKGGIIKAEEGTKTKTNWMSKIGNGLKNFGESKVGQQIISQGLSTIFGGGNSSNNDISKVAEDFNNSKLESINQQRLQNLEYARNLLESKSDPNNSNATEGVFKDYVLGQINNMYYGELQRQQRLKEEQLNQYKKDLETNKWMSIVQGAAQEIPSYFSNTNKQA